MTTHRGRPRSFDRRAALDKAVRLFWRHGYEGTSMRDLTLELGIAAPSLYHAFGSKQQMFDEAVKAYDEEYGGFIDAALAQEPTARQAATRLFTEAPARYSRRGLPPGCLIISGDAGTADPAVTGRLRDIREAKVEAVVDKIQADIASGALPSHTNALALARYTMSTLSGLAQAARDGVERAELEQVAQLALKAWA